MQIQRMGSYAKTILFFLVLGLLCSWSVHGEEAADCEKWKELAIEYKEISNELAAELTMYQKEFPKLLTITASLQEKLILLSQTSNQILERQRESLASSKTIIDEVKEPLSGLSGQISDLESSLQREIARNEVLTYTIIGLIGVTVVETGILLLK